jgi:2-dehydropantoate 2-reductase
MAENEDEGFKHVIIFGAGAIGSYYGALLSTKVDVLLIGRRDHVDAINDGGLVVSGSLGGRFRIRASTELNDVPQDSLILLTTKAHDSWAVIKGVRGILKPDTTILVLQNGLGNEALVSSLVGPGIEVVRGLASSGVEFLVPGRIEVKFSGDTVLPKTQACERMKRLLDSCGLKTRLAEWMDVEIWRKLTFNCVINPLTALFRVPNKVIAHDALREIRRGVVDECIRVAKEEGIVLEPSLQEEVNTETTSYSNKSSMCQDIIKGRKTEIDFLNGKVSELGRRHGVPTPVNDVLTALIRFMEVNEWT